MQIYAENNRRLVNLKFLNIFLIHFLPLHYSSHDWLVSLSHPGNSGEIQCIFSVTPFLFSHFSTSIVILIGEHVQLYQNIVLVSVSL